MKKILSVLLATLMLFSTVFVGISVTAAETTVAPIKATPITDITLNNGASGVATSVLTKPFGWVDASGVKLTVVSGVEHKAGDDTVADTWKNSYVTLPSGTTFADETALIFYVKTEAANAFIPMIGTKWGYIATPKMGATYYYASKDATEWSEGTVVQTGAEKTGSNYHGTIAFDSAFEGYVKIDLKNIGHNDIGGISSGYAFSYIKIGFQGLGGDYGDTIITGPYFLVNEDSTSTVIEVDEAYKPAPIKATPVTGFETGNDYSETIPASTVTPLGWVVANGIKLTANSGVTYVGSDDVNSHSWYHTRATMPSGITFGSETAIIIYVKTETANVLIPKISTKWGYVATPKMGATYYYAAKGATDWNEGTVVKSGAGESGSNYHGALVFDSAFEGYIKINLSDLGHNDIGGIASGYALSNIYLGFKGLGGDYGNSIVAGPYFLVTEDSNSTEIEVPESYLPTPIKATPLTKWSLQNNFSSTVAIAETTPLNWVNAKGLKITAHEGSSFAGGEDVRADSTWQYIYAAMDSGQTFGSETHLIFYLKTESANAVIPKFLTKWSYYATPKMGATYYYAQKGDTEWTEGTVVQSGTAVSGSKYHGSLVFDAAFDGYVKIKLSDLGHNDIGGIASGFALSGLYLNYKGIGGEYGDSITFGPYLLVTEDSTSTEIEVPDEYKPGDVKVSPITNYQRTNYYSGTVTCTTSNPLDYTSASGIKLVPSNDAYTKPDTTAYASSPVRTTVSMVTPYAVDGMEAFVLYLDMSAANTVYPMFTVDTAALSYNVTMALKPGTVYYTLEEGGSEWVEHTVEFLGLTENTSIHGGMVFDSAFKGYVKFAPQNITCGDISKPGSGAYIDRIDICFKGIGGDFGSEIIAGPYFSATSDSISTSISINKVIGDIDKDATCNDTDLTILRSYIIGNDNRFVATNGNVNSDSEGEIDITDLVYLAGIVDDIVFSADAYYQTEYLSGDIKSLSAYVYVPETVNQAYTAGVLFGSNNGTAVSYLNFGIAANGKPTFANGTDTLTFDGNVQTGDWAHLVYVIDDSANTATVYLNGESLGAQVISDYTSVKDMPFVLGGDAVDGNINYFKGKIGEVALYSTALSATDVADIYSAGTAANADIALWNVGSTVAGKKITDKAGNNDLDAYTTFFDEKNAVTDYAYSFAVVGDTQTITASSQPEHLSNIYNWILSNKEEKKIEFVMGLGDITDGDKDFEWENAQTEISKLNGVIPYTVIRGNHDSVTKINTYFGTEAYIGQFKDGADYYGFYTEDESDIRNTYRTFTTSTGVKYLIMTLDFGPYDDVLTWADSVLSDETFADYKVVITTHAYMYNNETTLDATEDGAATSYKYDGDSVAKIATNEDSNWAELTNNGDDIYNKLVSRHSNIVLVLSGHVINDEIVYRQDTYENGNVVTQMLIDPQGVDAKYNGVGLVALLYFSNDGNTITVEYYSTVKEQYFLRENQFAIDISNRS